MLQHGMQQSIFDDSFDDTIGSGCVTSTYKCRHSQVLQNFTLIIANKAADPGGWAVELANHRAVRENRRKISSQRKGPFFDHIWV